MSLIQDQNGKWHDDVGDGMTLRDKIGVQKPIQARIHRNQASYPALWSAIDGAVRDAVNCHPDIQIPERRIASIVKRAVGSVLALEARAVSAAENGPV